MDEDLKHQSLKDWVHTFGDELFSWALHKTSDREVAEDLVQETFLSAFKSFDSFRGQSNAKTWLFKILNNKIIDHYRKSSKQLFSNFESILNNQSKSGTDALFDRIGNWTPNGLEDQWNDEGHLLDDPEFNVVMEKCMDDLPGSWKTAVLWKYHLDKEAHEICQELEITSSNYWQILHRAKLMLKKCLELKWFVA